MTNFGKFISGYGLLILFLAALFLLPGCAMYRAVVAEEGAKASDAALETAIWTVCYGVPVGAVRRYFDTTELQDAYKALCGSAVPVERIAAR